MQKDLLIKKNEDFKSVYRQRKSKADKFFIVYCAENNKDISRIGISVSKKVGNSVVRHRIKRLIKECYRLNLKNIKIGYDIVVVARKDANNIDFNQVYKSFFRLIEKHGIYWNEDN